MLLAEQVTWGVGPAIPGPFSSLPPFPVHGAPLRLRHTGMRRSLHRGGQGPGLHTCSKSKRVQPIGLPRGDHLACITPSSAQQARDRTAISRLLFVP